jgi:hypothetical protein
MWIRLTRLVAVAFVFLLFVPAISSAEDVIELKTGAKLRCKIVSVSSQVVVIRARIGTRTFTRKYPLSKVSAIVRDGKRRTFGKSKPSRNKSKKPGTGVVRVDPVGLPQDA